MNNFNSLYHNNIYGGYINMTFSEIFENNMKFIEEYEAMGFSKKLTPEEASDMFYLLYSEYGNSPIASSDINRFKYKLFTIINTEGDVYCKRMDIQHKLIEIDLDDPRLREGSTQIYNHAYNPSVAPTTQTTDEITTINDQNVNKSKRGYLEAMATLTSLLDEDLTRKFLARFSKLFVQFATPEDAYWYVTNRPNEINIKGGKL